MITLYHAARTRSLTALWMLEELGEPYLIKRLDLNAREHKKADYLAINPMGKVPAVVVDGVAVSERPAICLYLTDRFPSRRLGPAIEDPRRALYLRWLFFAVGCIEPAFMDKAMQRDSPPAQAAWGSYTDVVRTLAEGLAGRTWLLGDEFSAADVVVGSMVHWGIAFKLLEGEPFVGYLTRLQARPALQRALAKDAG